MHAPSRKRQTCRSGLVLPRIRQVAHISGRIRSEQIARSVSKPAKVTAEAKRNVGRCVGIFGPLVGCLSTRLAANWSMNPHLKQRPELYRLHPRLRVLVVVMGLFGAACAANANQPIGSNYFSIVPSNWRLSPEDEQTHGREFMSPSGDAWPSLYARPPGSESIEAHLEGVKIGEHERITYERAGRTWIVVSGYKGDRIFYRKAMLACGGRS